MRYHLKDADSEWAIERSGNERWVLNKRTEGDWQPVGTYRSPNEAAVTVGAQMTAGSRRGERHLSRLKFVLSSWQAG
jgi:hypothetical protein